MEKRISLNNPQTEEKEKREKSPKPIKDPKSRGSSIFGTKENKELLKRGNVYEKFKDHMNEKQFSIDYYNSVKKLFEEREKRREKEEQEKSTKEMEEENNETNSGSGENRKENGDDLISFKDVLKVIELANNNYSNEFLFYYQTFKLKIIEEMKKDNYQIPEGFDDLFCLPFEYYINYLDGILEEMKEVKENPENFFREIWAKLLKIERNNVKREKRNVANQRKKLKEEETEIEKRDQMIEEYSKICLLYQDLVKNDDEMNEDEKKIKEKIVLGFQRINAILQSMKTIEQTNTIGYGSQANGDDSNQQQDQNGMMEIENQH